MHETEVDVLQEPGEGVWFETLLMNLSARFISLPPGEVDGGIEAALCDICEGLNLDRSTVWQCPAEEPAELRLTHVYQRPDAPPVPTCGDARLLFPWTFDRLRRGETLLIRRLSDLPPEAACDRESWQRAGTKSTVVIPLSIGGAGLCAMSFATVRTLRDWSNEIVSRLELFAQVIANAIARAASDRALRESRERYTLAVDGAYDGLWDWDVTSDRVYFSPRWKSMLGYVDHEVEGTFTAWEQLLHPDDREYAHATLQAHLRGETAVYELEHRLRAKDGTFRWIRARGKVLRYADNRPHRMAGSHTDITERKQAEQDLQKAYEEVQRLRDRLARENIYLRDEIDGLYGHGRTVAQSQAFRRVLAQAAQVAPTDSTVLLLGETGTGKELIAATIHERSPRRAKTMVRVNCAAIPDSLLESELFGREKGAYTGALSKQIGRFELASESTLFLDEIGDLPPQLQVKLLRVLQEKQFERLGDSKTIQVDVRIIAATNRDLEQAVREKTFRDDLYYRLNVFPITVPPLRERHEDIAMLVSVFVQEFATRFGKNIDSIDSESLIALQHYNWPGNVRELRNVIERAMIVATGPRLRIEPPSGVAPAPSSSLALRDAEEQHIRNVLGLTGWRIRGSNGAAELLGLKPSTLESRMAKLGIRRVKRPPK